uniref:Uncharacterized protein n=1 Tax=Eutreptiella gymnastica TaxID=73025 RepID=A0A7S1N180_9EUGL
MLTTIICGTLLTLFIAREARMVASELNDATSNTLTKAGAARRDALQAPLVRIGFPLPIRITISSLAPCLTHRCWGDDGYKLWGVDGDALHTQHGGDAIFIQIGDVLLKNLLLVRIEAQKRRCLARDVLHLQSLEMLGVRVEEIPHPRKPIQASSRAALDPAECRSTTVGSSYHK